MARSLNRVQLIGNLTRDPELRYTPNGTAVCSFGIATNRNWTTDTGEKHDEAEFHKIVAWNKLAELCSQFLVKGRKVFVEGRLATRNWQAQDGTQRTSTEVVISDMILLDSRRPEEDKMEASPEPSEEQVDSPRVEAGKPTKNPSATLRTGKVSKKVEDAEQGRSKDKGEDSAPAGEEEEVAPDDIPF